MCSERDCRLFKGMIRVCDECRMYVALNEDGLDGRQPHFTSRRAAE
ncbi:MAG: hypothetical protein JSU93_04400 [Methanobacteriota archaeon]|nr:MAG: hypothetical protein JSU93_04400 [Euryarchaeota archaeon]